MSLFYPLFTPTRARNVPARRDEPDDTAPPDPYDGLFSDLWQREPGRRKADGTPNFVRTYTHPTSGRLAGVFADSREIDAAAFAAMCAEWTAKEIAEGLRPAPLAGWEAAPGTVYYAESIAGLTTRSKAQAVADAVARALRLPFGLEVAWFSLTDARGYQRAKFAGRFAEAREPGRILLGLYDADTPETLYVSASVVRDEAILENIAHEARHAWQLVTGSQTGREYEERDADAYAAKFVRAWQLVPYVGGGFGLKRR